MFLQAAFFVRTATLTAMLCALVGCITLGPDYDPQRATAVPNQPNVWQPPVAHDGRGEDVNRHAPALQPADLTRAQRGAEAVQ